MPTTGDLITTREAAMRLGLSQERVRQLIRAGLLPSRRIRKWLFVAEQDLARLRKDATGAWEYLR